MSDELPIHRWTVGDATIVRVTDVAVDIPAGAPVPDWAVPHFGPSPDEVGIAFTALAIEVDGRRIVVDPWLANEAARERHDAPEHAAALLGALAEAGVPPDEVDLVVNTHLDGVGWNSKPDGDGGWALSFPHARYLYPEREIAALDRGVEIEGHEGFAGLRQLTAIELVDAPLQLTPSVALVDAPGHNDGHLAVRIESGGDLAVYPGHLVIWPWHVDDPSSGDPAEEPRYDELVATRTAIFAELADREGLLLTTLLAGSGAGRVHRHAAGFRLEPEPNTRRL
jgi:glyoxylase-like metal-dependent hydrolase (beta-lactamase superfamily II)